MAAIPEPSRRRLVQLAQLLSQLDAQQGTERITSGRIQELTGWSSSVIRRDISQLHFRGGVSSGYNIRELHDAVVSALNIGAGTAAEVKCCIVGLGRLGAALLEDSIFENTPFRIAAGFDSSVNRTEILRSTFPLHPASRLEAVIAAENIRYAILAVPDREAQKMAERLALCGIRGIVNYTGAVLSVPDGVAVENVSPVTALENLSARIAGKE